MHATELRKLLNITEHRATIAIGTSAHGYPRRIELVDNTIVHIVTIDGLQMAYPCHTFTGALFHEALGHWNEKDTHPTLLHLIRSFSNGIKLDTNRDEWEIIDKPWPEIKADNPDPHYAPGDKERTIVLRSNPLRQ